MSEITVDSSSTLNVLDCIIEGNLKQLSESHLQQFTDKSCLIDLFDRQSERFEQAVEPLLLTLDVSLLQRPILDQFCTRFLLQVPRPNTLIRVAQQLTAESYECFRREKLLGLLIKLLGNQTWMIKLMCFCNCQSSANSSQLLHLESLLVNFPTSISNQFKLFTDKFFRSETFYNHLTDILFRSLIHPISFE
jgi:hypothetical protein